MYIDIFLIVLIVWAVYNGWRNGLVKELLHIAGAIAGLLLALACYAGLGKYLTVDGSQQNMVLSLIAFLILCFILPIALGFVANMFSHLLRQMKLGIPNSLLGAVVSVVKFLLIISFAFNIMETLGIMNPERVATSHLYAPSRDFLFFMKDRAAAHTDTIGTIKGEQSDTTYIYFNRPDSTGNTVNR